MKLIVGYLSIFIFYLIGELLSRLLTLPVPAAIYGLLLLFLTLAFIPALLPGSIMVAAQQLIRMLSLLLLPATTGIFFLPDNFSAQLPAIIGGIVLATILSMILTIFLMRGLLTYFRQSDYKEFP